LVFGSDRTVAFGDGTVETDGDIVRQTRPKPSAPSQAVSVPDIEAISIKDELTRAAAVKRTGFSLLGMFKFFTSGKLQRAAAVVIMFSAVLIALSMSFIGNATRVDYTKFQESHPDLITVFVNGDGDTGKINDIANSELVRTLVPYQHSMPLSWTQRSMIQGNIKTAQTELFTINPLPLSLITDGDLLYGRMPVNNFEVVLDKFYIDKLFAETGSVIARSSVFGIVDVQSFLGSEFVFYANQKIAVVGISDTAAPTVYMSVDLLYTMHMRYVTNIEEQIFTENLTDFIATDIAFDNVNEIYISKEEWDEKVYAVGDEIVFDYATYVLKGYYEPKDSADGTRGFIVPVRSLENAIYKSMSLRNSIEAVVTDKAAAVAYFGAKYLYAQDVLQGELDRYLGTVKAQMTVQIVFTVLMIAAAAIIYYFVIQASVFERRRELAIKSALGIQRRRIYAEFILNAIVFFAVFALPVYLLTLALIKGILSKMGGYLSMMSVTFSGSLLGIGILLALPIIISILPLARYLQKSAGNLLKYN
jgi:ABC-type antimicrobial peptide transport system permease subunit